MGRRRALGMVIADRVGFFNAARVVGLIAAWAWWVEHKGEDPSQRQLEGNSKRSQASWSRDLRLFRKAFPGEDSPARIARELIPLAKRQERPLQPAAFMALNVPEELFEAA